MSKRFAGFYFYDRIDIGFSVFERIANQILKDLFDAKFTRKITGIDQS
jgi:hypothetical protein